MDRAREGRPGGLVFAGLPVSWTGLAFLVLALACAVPMFVFDVVPGADLPIHMAILRHLADAMADPAAFSRELAVRPWQPYWGFYAPTLLLSLVLPLDLAARGVLFLAMVCLPLSIAAIARREGADSRVALAAFPLVFGFNFYWGFAPFYVSACLAVAGLLPAMRFARRGSMRSLAGLHLVSLLLFSAHATAWVLWAAWSAWVWLTEPRRPWRRPLMGATAFIGPVGLFALWKASAGLERITQAPATHSLNYKAWHLVHHAFPSLSPGAETATALGFLLLLGLGAVTARGGSTGGMSRGWRCLRWGGLALGMFAAYWVLPQDVAEFSFVYPRFLVFAGLFALPCLARPLRWGRAFTVAALVLGLASFGFAGVGFARFERRAAGAGRCLAHAAAGSVLMPFAYLRDDPDLRYPLFLHAGAWHVTANRGRVYGDWIEALPTSMVHWRDAAGLDSPPPVFLWAPRPLEDPSVAGRVAYFLVHGPRQVRFPGGDPVDLDAALLTGLDVAPQPICEDGRWRLYSRRADSAADVGSAAQGPLEPREADPY